MHGARLDGFGSQEVSDHPDCALNLRDLDVDSRVVPDSRPMSAANAATAPSDQRNCPGIWCLRLSGRRYPRSPKVTAPRRVRACSGHSPATGPTDLWYP